VLKTDLIERVAGTNPHLRLGDAEKIVKTIFEEMTAAMARGDRVELRGIGAFTVRVRRGRPGQNPRSGAKIVVPERLYPHFRPGKPMRERLNRTSAE
jgi:integration host factor subunit beta